MFSKSKGNQVHEVMMEQFKHIKSCLESFEEFLNLECAEDHDLDTLRSLCDAVYDKETAADYALDRMIDSLTDTLLLPQTREELISLSVSCDKIANKCEGTSYMMTLQQFFFPADFNADLNEIVELTHKQFAILEDAISKLFGDFANFLKDHAILDEIREYESKVDRIERKLLEKTYRGEVSLAEQMQCAKFVQDVCDLSDIIEDIADKIQIMLVTRKA